VFPTKNKLMKKEIHVFLTAIMFFTRIPVPKTLPYSPEYLNNSMRYFTIIGAIIGAVALVVFYGMSQIVPLQIAIFISMLSTILLTGAFHEDGFADFCDGFGGGYTKDKILLIMKDSRIGTYGSIGLIGMLGSKFLFLSYINVNQILFVILVGHIASRVLPVFIIHNLPYVQDEDVSKSKPVGTKSSVLAPIISAIILGTILAFKIEFALYLIPAYILLYFAYSWYIKKKVGGYSGDILGALQQLSEFIFYLMFIIYQNS